MLIGRPFDKQGLPVGLYHPIFDEFEALLNDPTTTNYITHGQLSKISEFCTAAVAIYRKEKDRVDAMSDLLGNILYPPITPIHTASNALSDGTIVTIAHGMSLYRAILEWKNDMGEGGCDPVKQGCFSFRDYWVQPNVRTKALFSFASLILIF